MNANKILAIVIVLVMLLTFMMWFVISGALLLTAPKQAISVIIPGMVYFGFWFLIAYRLYNSTYSS
jgi:ACR3 family arsenite efflux pump ArsB